MLLVGRCHPGRSTCRGRRRACTGCAGWRGCPRGWLSATAGPGRSTRRSTRPQESVTVRALATAAGTSTAAMYTLFQGKDGLIREGRRIAPGFPRE
ncbi:TetR family transcriptional regulator [Streptomyces sp. NPDC057575]|uniref:TetR family transcriptional regulator n=1 Tax=unclassified Streptomyces TaxID=2593676 RepID=UPI003698C0E4